MSAQVSTRESIEAVAVTPWEVVLLDDDHHTFDFVIWLTMTIFRLEFEAAYAVTMAVHMEGEGIASRCSKERAELYLEQVQSMPEDALRGALGCLMRPA